MSGRQMGDETVIRTARSIQSAERSVLEQQAVSFRVDGGEFAIIVKNPQKTPEEWEHFIKEEMKEECGNRQPVRLKFGYSYLRKKNGSLLSFSDWKQQADDMLCSNK